ncbi:hypothetical protein HanRHA438_Chr03g0101231 [Helianthus annuus]|nr:hypothetical protein HanRHA438_Chr03g0101231 [Helianthus annuus]
MYYKIPIFLCLSNSKSNALLLSICMAQIDSIGFVNHNQNNKWYIPIHFFSFL